MGCIYRRKWYIHTLYKRMGEKTRRKEIEKKEGQMRKEGKRGRR